MSPTEVETLAASLRKLETGFLPYPIFSEISRLVTVPTIEVVVLSNEPRSDLLKIFLLKRPSDDAWWPDQWHVAGSILRSTDSKDSFTDAFRRIEDEYGFKFPSEPIYLKTHFRQEKRGAAIAMQYYMVVDSQTIPSANLFDTDALPALIVREHIDLINLAIQNVQSSAHQNS